MAGCDVSDSAESVCGTVPFSLSVKNFILAGM